MDRAGRSARGSPHHRVQPLAVEDHDLRALMRRPVAQQSISVDRPAIIFIWPIEQNGPDIHFSAPAGEADFDRLGEWIASNPERLELVQRLVEIGSEA